LLRAVQRTTATVAILALLAGCEANAELGLLLGPLEQVLAVAAHPRGSAVEVELVLVGWEGQPLGVDDRVRSGSEVRWLAELAPVDLHTRGAFRLDGVAANVAAHPRRLDYRGRERREVVVLLLDNGQAAAAADRGLARIAAAQATADALLCAAPGAAGCRPRELALIVSEAGRAELRVPRTRDAARVRAALSPLPASAGGKSPLWDGMLAAAHELRSAGGSGALLGYLAEESGSVATPAEAWGSLDASPALPAWLAAEPALLPALAGAAIPVGAGGAAPALLAARAALDGVWRLELELGVGASAVGQRLQGELELVLGPERHVVALDLALGPER
jgi:hypothetical protein